MVSVEWVEASQVDIQDMVVVELEHILDTNMTLIRTPFGLQVLRNECRSPMSLAISAEER